MVSIKTRKVEILGLCAAALLSMVLFAAHPASALVTSAIGPGDSGADVSELQTFLAMDSSVYPEGIVSGFYGSLTTSAVQRFQCKYAIVCSGDVSSSGYGRVGPLTLAKIQSLQGGVSLPPVGIPSGADVNAPVLSQPTTATSSTSATISWTTSENANNRVMYGTTWPFLYATAPSVASATIGTSPVVSISGLTPSTTYFYVLESVDASGNIQYGIDHSFRTNP